MRLLLEHEATPGTVLNENFLICEYGNGYYMNNMDFIAESNQNNSGEVRFRGKFQEADAVNKNKRTYPFEVLNTCVEHINRALKEGPLIGELDHPTDSIIHFKSASHKIDKLWWEGKVLMGEGTILNTPEGKILRSLINDGVRIGISSRGVGNGKVNENGILVIGESYKLITFDAVADPSTNQAFQKRVVSANEASDVGNSHMPQETHNNVIKNETSSIHNNITKEIVLAAFSGIVHKEGKNIRARLS